MSKLSRRKFIGSAIVASGAVATGAVATGAFIAGRSAPNGTPETDSPGSSTAMVIRHGLSATDRVSLGRSGVKVSLVGIGTGSMGWAHQSNQTRLGQEAFTRLIRHGLDN